MDTRRAIDELNNQADKLKQEAENAKKEKHFRTAYEKSQLALDLKNRALSIARESFLTRDEFSKNHSFCDTVKVYGFFGNYPKEHAASNAPQPKPAPAPVVVRDTAHEYVPSRKHAR